jgi:hypothetical protein
VPRDPFARPKRLRKRLDPLPTVTIARRNQSDEAPPGAMRQDAPPRAAARAGVISHAPRRRGGLSGPPPAATPDRRPARSVLHVRVTVLGDATGTLDPPAARSVRRARDTRREVRATATRVTRGHLAPIARMRKARRNVAERAADRLGRHGLASARPRHSRPNSASVKTRAIRPAAKAGGAWPVKAPSTSPAPATS